MVDVRNNRAHLDLLESMLFHKMICGERSITRSEVNVFEVEKCWYVENKAVVPEKAKSMVMGS